MAQCGAEPINNNGEGPALSVVVSNVLYPQ